ncbi:thymidine kinase, putative [Trypanosoma brucei brucei TREU927]|uniref:thymidine kinase n=1 Tax=Trypanosoma brucei brucei (strain 927/4 GUTat10.1) TaxID=185431 RepID=Q38CF2_TRYB2|nr:thymidine kinase, putative [Trypanosoma brucei brucei TREU927]EAN77518.1 thymidine kinase, putative [Trypanosoma brucei brucei TREU927]
MHDGDGNIELIIGPMFAGKTTELMRRVQRHKHAQRSCYIINYSRNSYQNQRLSTHDQLSLTANVSIAKLSEVCDEWRDYDVIAVDNGQFFPDVVGFCARAANEGKTVIVSALDVDCRETPFDEVCRLVPRAESVLKLSAVCMECHEHDAFLTYRTIESNERELYGGADMYLAVCRWCYKQLTMSHVDAQKTSASTAAVVPNGAHGRIELIIGPMFAGKTTELMRRVQRHKHAQRSCYIIKYTGDTRYSEGAITSHDQRALTANVSVSNLHDVGDEWRKYDVIAVDEGQFFPGVAAFCSKAADSGKVVIVSALDADYLQEPFEEICLLVSRADSVVKLSAVCMECHNRKASFTYRTVKSDERKLVGGSDMYMSVCRSCYETKRNMVQTEKYIYSCVGINEGSYSECSPGPSERSSAGTSGVQTSVKVDEQNCTEPNTEAKKMPLKRKRNQMAVDTT